MTGFVVRSDVGTVPMWLCEHWLYADRLDMTEVARDAIVFRDAEKAQLLADRWSDFPGVWRVVARGKTRKIG